MNIHAEPQRYSNGSQKNPHIKEALIIGHHLCEHTYVLKSSAHLLKDFLFHLHSY